MSLAAEAFALTSGRLVGTIAAVVALAGTITGVFALTRGSRGRRARGNAALTAGVVGLAVGAWVLAVADGGPGSGSGVVGGAAAAALGLAAVILGARARSRKAP